MLKADAATSVADKTISVDEFQKVLVYDKRGKVVLNKKGKPSERLAPIRQQVNANCLIQFISELLPVIIHHRNMLKRYRSLIKPFLAMIDTVNMDIDFSENLTLGMKFEPSSMHWVKQQISVHSGILKLDEVKEYHPYISVSRTHDQAFVKVAVDEMFNSSTSNIPEDKNFSIESDNCTGQYKSSHHFGDMQSLANKHLRMVISIFVWSSGSSVLPIMEKAKLTTWVVLLKLLFVKKSRVDKFSQQQLMSTISYRISLLRKPVQYTTAVSSARRGWKKGGSWMLWKSSKLLMVLHHSMSWSSSLMLVNLRQHLGSVLCPSCQEAIGL